MPAWDDPRKVEKILSLDWLDLLDAREQTGDPSANTSPFADRDGTHRSLNGGDQWEFSFANGYGASVVRSPMSYGGDAGQWELAVLGTDGHLTYDTPITDDVIGWLLESDVAALLAKIEELPKP
jgi:hypothetical protein